MKTKNNKRNRKISSSTFCLLIALIITGFGALAAGDPARDESAGEDADKTLADETPPPPKQPHEKEPALATELEEMTVTGQPMGELGYTVPNATTATKTDTPIMETPVSIQVVPRQVLQDQQATRIEDAVKNVSGVQSDFNYGDEGYGFFIRGFNTFDVFHNGFRAASGQGILGITNVERIEILKGPAAALYGRIEPGGLINLVSKRPLFSP